MNSKIKKITFGFIISALFIIIVIQVFNIIAVNVSAKRYEEMRQLALEINTEITTESEPYLNEIEESTNQNQYAYKVNNQKIWLDQNTDFTGWLRVEGTKIDYPVVRGNDNIYYLNRDFLKKTSKAGAIFMDYRNIGQFSDKHTVIYGHYMKDGTMFGDLHQYKSKAFYDENRIIEFEGLYENKSYTIFSVTLETADDYEIDLKLSNDAYLNQILGTSIHETRLIPESSMAILTLVTCSYEVDNGRILIHAYENW